MHPTIPEAPRCQRIEWLPTEASGRRYARLHRPVGLQAPTAVLMLFPPRTRPGEVERVARATHLLGELGVPVPAVHRVEAQHGWILQEDLGDLTLAGAREEGRQVAPYYSAAVNLLPRLEPARLDTSPRPPLDEKRLTAELEHFARTALSLPEGPGPELAAEFQKLVERCTSVPVVLCHRDYHSRNLLVQGDQLRVVDHQDALPGPRGYDRVSLAYDPYVDLPDPIRDRIAGEGDELAALAVQRLAKAIGTFAEKGGAWIDSITPAAQQARRLLKRDELGLPMLDIALATLPARVAKRAAAMARAAGAGTQGREAAASGPASSAASSEARPPVRRPATSPPAAPGSAPDAGREAPREAGGTA